jgi:hypothetical protein
MIDWRDVEFGISEEEILARVRTMVADTDFIENNAPHADEWDHANPDLSNWALFFNLEFYWIQEYHAEREGREGRTWLLQAKWDQQRRERPDELPTLYTDDYAGWVANVLQSTCDDSDGLTQREIGDSDPTALIDYLNTSKTIASASAESLGSGEDASKNKQHVANMQELMRLVDSRLEALDRGMMFPDDLQDQLAGRTADMTHIFGGNVERAGYLRPIIFLIAIAAPTFAFFYFI